MPKARSSKLMKKEDFIYTSNCTDRLLVGISNSAVHNSGNGGSGTRAMSFESMRDRSPPKSRDDTQVFSFANDLQTFFPREETQRQEYRTRNGKKVTKYQWDVYDFILKIPRGKVTTYKTISECIGGSARSGGFCGQWAGRKSASQKSEDKGQDQIRRKVGLLKEEGIEVDGKGFLLDRESVIWRYPDAFPLSLQADSRIICYLLSLTQRQGLEDLLFNILEKFYSYLT